MMQQGIEQAGFVGVENSGAEFWAIAGVSTAGSAISTTGDYTYNSLKPHAVKRISLTQANAGAISSSMATVSYNILNRPETISDSGYTLTLSYGADEQRQKTVFKQGTTILKTKYFINDRFEYEKIGNNTRMFSSIYADGRLVAIAQRINGGTDSLFYVFTDHLGSYDYIVDQNKVRRDSLNFDSWGNCRNYTLPFLSDETNHLFERGFTGHEHLDQFKIINMNARLYDPIIGRFFSPDPFIANNTFTQDFNRYSYCRNNPMSYTDPSGEFIQYIIGAIIGGFSGYMMADNLGYKDWDKFWYTLGGAAIGAATAGIGTAVSSSAGVVAGGIVGGAAGGAGFGTMGGYAAGLRGGDLFNAGFNGMWQGAVTGLAGSFVGGAIGGGWGALAGGATAGGLGTWMSGGSGEDILKGAALGGVMGLGVYHAALAYSYHTSGIKSTGLNYNQYAKMIATTQRSMFWNREGKFIPNSRDGINVNKLGGVNDVGVTGADYNDALFDYHTHQDWGSTLADGEGFSTYASGGVRSDEYARSQLNLLVKFKGPMYLGTREGHIWYMNSNFSRGMLPYNFSPVFTPFNITWSLSLIR